MRKTTQSKQKGQALVESALSMLVFLTMILGILDFGQFIYFQQSLTERVRAAARVAILDPTQTDRIKNVAMYNTYVPAEGQSKLLSSLTADMISISTANLGTPEGVVTVTISNYPISFITPALKSVVKAPIVSVTYPSEAPW